jgi:hypothetical protein
MSKKLLFIAALIGLWASPCFAQQNIAAQIKETVEKNMQTTQAEDTTGMMETIHTQSPFYLMTKQQMQPLFDNYDLNYELLSYEYIGRSGDYAIARVNFQTTKVSGPAFKDNELDVIQIYKQENGTWKLWSQSNLDIKFLNN